MSFRVKFWIACAVVGFVSGFCGSMVVGCATPTCLDRCAAYESHGWPERDVSDDVERCADECGREER